MDYNQNLMVYRGVPQWTRNNLPEVKIGQPQKIEIPITDFTQDDISGDHFNYLLDKFHSPNWVQLINRDNQTYLAIEPAGITANETETVQTIRVLSISHITHKTSAQLLMINVKSNPDLPKPSWRIKPPLVATVGVAHGLDLSQYIQSSIPSDRLAIKLSPDSPSWLSLKDNRLLGMPTKDQIGGPYTVTFNIYSQASNTNTDLQMPISVQFAVVNGDNMETHEFFTNHRSIVIRGLEKNHKYHLVTVKGTHFDYGPFYSPHAIKTEEDWDGNPFYAVNKDNIIETGDDGTVSLVYYALAGNPRPQFDLIVLR